jgi:hypothetical protein
MNTTLALVTLVAVPFAVAVFLREVLRQPTIRYFEDLATKTVNRNRFGEVRTHLMALARDERVDPRDELFVLTYRALTVLMREPHDYAEAARYITAAAQKAKPADGKVGAIPSRDMVLVMMRFGEALDRMCSDFFWLYRLLVRLAPERPMPLIFRMFARRMKPADMESVLTARQQLSAAVAHGTA